MISDKQRLLCQEENIIALQAKITKLENDLDGSISVVEKLTNEITMLKSLVGHYDNLLDSLRQIVRDHYMIDEIFTREEILDWAHEHNPQPREGVWG